MTTAFEESESSVRLTSRSRISEDSSMLCGTATMEHCEPLLGNGVQDQDTEPQHRIWSKIPFLKHFNARRRGKPEVLVEPDSFGTRKRSRRYLTVGIGFLALLGVVQLLSLLWNSVILAIPDGIHDLIGSWGKPGNIGAGLSHWPTDFTRDILPIPCHSHNDYWRKVPVYSAIEAGCIGIEADIWLFTGELYVGHSVASLTPNRTLSSLYINPLLDILSRQNQKPLVIPNSDQALHGVFDTTPGQTVILLIDFKTSGTALFPHVVQALEPLRSKGYLTRRNGSDLIQGPVTVVGTGETPFNMVISETENPHHDIFFDAPLSEMYEGSNGEAATSVSPESEASQPHSSNEESDSRRRHRGSSENRGEATSAVAEVYDTTNSFYASTSFAKAIGALLDSEFSDHQLDLLRGQIRGAHRRGLQARYWDLPFWPIHLRNHVWDVLVKEGVDLLNVDDLKGATKRNWAQHHGWWKRMKGTSENMHGNFGMEEVAAQGS